MSGSVFDSFLIQIQLMTLIFAYRLETELSPAFATQILAPSKATPTGPFPYVEGSDQSAVAAAQLDHVVAAEIRYPNIDPIKHHCLRQR